MPNRLRDVRDLGPTPPKPGNREIESAKARQERAIQWAKDATKAMKGEHPSEQLTEHDIEHDIEQYIEQQIQDNIKSKNIISTTGTVNEITASRSGYSSPPEGSLIRQLEVVCDKEEQIRLRNEIIAGKNQKIISTATDKIAKANWPHLSKVETDIRNLHPKNTTNPHYTQFRADVDASKAFWRNSSRISPSDARSGDAYSIVVAAKAHSEMWADATSNPDAQKSFLRNLRAIQSYAQALPFIT